MSKTILVSGANGNLGKAVVQNFLKNNYTVIGLVHHQKDEIKNENYNEFEVDLTDEAATAKTINAILEKHQDIAAAVLTTGGFTLGNIEKTGQKELQKQYALNFETAYFVTRSVLPNMKKNKKGKIFFIGSEPGMQTSKAKGVVAYALAKSQLFQLANILNSETEKTGIQAHVVVPTTIDTPQNRKAVPKADFNKWQKSKDIAEIIQDYAEDFTKQKSIIEIKNILK